jgi:hypothetical protein
MIYEKRIFGFRMNLKKLVLYSFMALLFIVALTLVGMLSWIYIDARAIAKDAIEVFHKDNIESLLMVIDSDKFTLKEKNHAIWALGVYRDERALEKLESLVTREKCDHSRKLCQYEIEKAILKIKGEMWSARKPFKAYWSQ